MAHHANLPLLFQTPAISQVFRLEVVSHNRLSGGERNVYSGGKPGRSAIRHSQGTVTTFAMRLILGVDIPHLGAEY